ncbi:MAG: IS200/IS605 family element RNA-guided endonuclease TnpB [Planctomycetota bacterium]|nr:IS200/IS605 family element RNA-guided endonuclease TnpB [Planctomycetota bacterium]
MKRAYKFRIYPNQTQESLLLRQFGCCRFVFNWALNLRSETYKETGKGLSYVDTAKELTKLKQQPETAWLNEVSNMCLQQSLRDLDSAFSKFFKKLAKYPNFKSKRHSGSARYQIGGFRLKEGKLHVAKIKAGIKVKWSRELPSSPSNVTVSRNSAGQWFASFLCEDEIEKLKGGADSIGVDLGITDFATLSTGEKIKLPKRIKQQRAKLRRAQKSLSRKKKGSNNRAKARLKVARIHQQTTNIRNDFLHKLSTRLIRENQTVGIENLNVTGMVKNPKLARAISEQGWREFRTMLEYKADWYGREIQVADRFFPSSKLCSTCGAKNSGLKLGDRKWKCRECDTIHDRDVNAAINLAVGRTVSACGEGVSPEVL